LNETSFLSNFGMITYFEWAIVVMIIWYLDLQLPMQSVPITTNIVSLNQTYGEVHSMQHYVIKFVSDLWQAYGFLWVLQFPPPIKLTAWSNWNIVESGVKHNQPNLF
jgi:hypothetical protein